MTKTETTKRIARLRVNETIQVGANNVTKTRNWEYSAVDPKMAKEFGIPRYRYIYLVDRERTVVARTPGEARRLAERN